MALDIQNIDITNLVPATYNPRTINKDEFAGLVESIKLFGIVDPVIVNKDLTIIGGHMRVNAAKQLGLTEVPCVVLDLDKHAEKKLNVILNSPAISGKYDEDKLTEVLYELKDDDDFELLRLDKLAPIDLSPEAQEDDAPDVTSDPPKSTLSEVYQLGDHRVMCGDSTSEDDIAQLMGSRKIDLYLTDPPYNVDYTGKTKDALKIDNDNKDDGEYLAFLEDAFLRATDYLKLGGSFYIFHADSEGFNVRTAVKSTGLLMKQCLIWVKQTMVMGRQDYQWQHEPILYGWKAGAAHNWFTDRKQTTILEFDRPSRSEEHPTMKPISILAYLIKNSSKPKELVFDNFLGSGSTLIACEGVDRVCYGIELDPRYVDVTRKRYAKLVSPDTWETEWEQLTPKIEG